VSRLAEAAIGMKAGEVITRELNAERLTGLPEKELTVRLARVRKRPRELRLSIDQYTAQTGLKPEVGLAFGTDPLIPGKIVTVTDREVAISFTPVKRDGIDTPFGPATVRDVADHYEIDIAARPGKLVRTGGMAGRIAAVDSESITIDYGHPFGGETLRCDLKVMEVKSATVLSLPKTANPSAISMPAAAAPETTEVLTRSMREFMASTAGTAANGDLASVQYTATLADGALFYTTRPEVANDPARPKVPWYTAVPNYRPEELLVGKPALFPGIGTAVAGMTPGEKKRLVLPPEQAFGQADPKKMVQFPLRRTLPRRLPLTAVEYVQRFDGFPTVGKEVPLTPWFPARVAAVTDRGVELEMLVNDGATFSDSFGTTSMKVAANEITTTLTPIIGAPFQVQSGVGIITATDGTNFTVDLNHPLAGQTITIDLELTSLTKAASLPAGEIPWLEEHDAGLAAAKKSGRPAVLVLHADWCTFCKKLFSETMPDPRITSLRDRFTWIRVNSDKLTDFKKQYGQDGYPMIVLFKADGTIARKLDGFQEAAAFRAALQDVL